MSQNFKIGKIWNFLRAFGYQTSSPNAQMWVFGQRSINFLICKWNFARTLFWRSWFQIWHSFLKILSPSAQFTAFCLKNYQFLILTIICWYIISKVLISNRKFVFEYFEPKYSNLSILDQNVLNFSNLGEV